MFLGELLCTPHIGTDVILLMQRNIFRTCLVQLGPVYLYSTGQQPFCRKSVHIFLKAQLHNNFLVTSKTVAKLSYLISNRDGKPPKSRADLHPMYFSPLNPQLQSPDLRPLTQPLPPGWTSMTLGFHLWRISPHTGEFSTFAINCGKSLKCSC